jgi:predicted deacetylase
MNAWERISDELDIWKRERRAALFWWRDDDAGDVSPNLKRMVEVAAAHRVSVGLSVIPLKRTGRLVSFVATRPNLDVLVHGYAHVSHARAGEEKREFSGARPIADMRRDLGEALAMQKAGFDKRVLPVLVPPWNRISPNLLQDLPKLGFRGYSTWKPRPVDGQIRGLLQVNAHLDPVNWRAGRVIKSEAQVASLLLRKLRWRRENPRRSLEPLGLLTHHEHWCAEKEQIVVTLLKATRNHPAVSWLSAREVFSGK